MENNIQSHIEYRNKPINITVADEYLFSKEYEYVCKEPAVRELKDVYFNSQGFIYTNYKPDTEQFSFVSSKDKNKLINFFKLYFFAKEINEEVVFFVHELWSEGYFHWNSEALVKLNFLLKYIAQNKTAKLLLPAFYLEIKFIKESLLLFGFNEKDIIVLKKDTVYKCKHLFCCSSFVLTGNYNTKATQSLAVYLKHKINIPTTIPQKHIYISRKKSIKRKIVNEVEVENLLKKYAFEIIETDEISYAQQIQLFNEAQWLISMHGAALTNMLFMNKQTNVLELREENDKGNNCYFSLASTMNLNYFYLKCKSKDKNDDHIGNLFVDIQALENLLKSYL